MKSLIVLSLALLPLAQAEPVKDEANIENYQQCMFSETVQQNLGPWSCLLSLKMARGRTEQPSSVPGKGNTHNSK